MSSLWSQDHRDEWQDPADIAATFDHPSNLTSILAAARNTLSLIPPWHLTFDKSIGKGSSFEVNREVYTKPEDKEWNPYYVAVKHMIVAERDSSHLQRHYDSVHRELRVLTHPGLNDHDNITPVLAYGWTNGISGSHPYLVVEWSNHGTLTEYLRRIKPSVEERRELALDVAAGLKALHKSNIIHGDLKPSNVLVFDTLDVSRPQMAKLADFGGSIFELDKDQRSIYGGTAVYNSPEQEGRGRTNRENTFTYQQLYQADIYSFGLTLWEILKNGHEYIEEGWLQPGESRLDALRRICAEEIDGILQRAITFCTSLFESHEQRSVLCTAILETFDRTLRDDSHKRSGIDKIMEVLARGTQIQRPQSAFPSVKNNPISTSSAADMMTQRQADGVPRAFTGGKLIVRAFDGVSANATVGSDNRPKPSKAEEEIGRSKLGTVPIKPPSMGLSQFLPANMNLFQTGTAPNPPWEVQHDVVELLKQTKRAEPEYHEACLQLALCYHIGFGVRPNIQDMFHFLTSSLPSHDTTEALYKRIVDALGSQADSENIDLEFESKIDKSLCDCQDTDRYFAKRIWKCQHSLVRRSSPQSLLAELSLKTPTLADIVTNGDHSMLSTVLSTREFSDAELSNALCISCRKGDADSAMLLCHTCKSFVADPEVPNPLHWLVMFEEQDIQKVGTTLVLGVSDDMAGPCKMHVNDVPSAGRGVFYFAEHCAEFFGTPLHWAVRARNPKLVQLLVKLGADVNIRWNGPKRFSSDVSGPSLPSLSPLDVAVAFHLPEVAELLIELGANLSGGSFEETHTAFHCIGLACVPFSRYIIHGKGYRNAMRKVMGVLVGRGSNIRETDTNGCDPLMIALKNPDCDPYIIEELLSAGALATTLTLDNGSDAAVLAACNALARRYNVSSLALVASRVANINEKDTEGRNPLHYAAIGGSYAMVEILARLPSFDINSKASDGQTALHFAALFGSVDMISVLVRNQADMEVSDSSGMTALQLATAQRKVAAADLLLNLGAETLFPSGTLLSKGSILHAAVAGASSADTMLRRLLVKHARLQIPNVINAVDLNGWTALHKAAYFGDCEAVETLLAYGADREMRDKSRGPCPGRTPLDRIEALLEQIMSSGLGIDHQRVRVRGQQAIGAFTANLKEIKRLLEDEYQM